MPGGQGRVTALFGVRRALIGMLHVGALPGSPRARACVDEIAEQAVSEARLLAAHGFHAVMIENMHDRPYLRRGVGPEVVAAMAVIGREVRRAVPLPLGVQVLAGANREALSVAKACGASFVRVEGFVFAHVADEGVIESDAGELLRFREAIAAREIAVFADVKKKHSAHALTADVGLAETAQAAEFFLADGVVVTGAASGRPARPEEVAEVAAAVAIPVLVGSGATPENVRDYAAADGVIVGSALKRDGLWSNPLDPARVAAMRAAFPE
jgi:membrane complex biogenesis BtpA family protein